MNILVLGAEGFVGKNLVCALNNIKQNKDRRYPEIIIDEIFGYDRNSSEDDLALYCSKADFIFNFAGVNRPKDVSEFIKGNCDFLGRVLAILKGCKNNCPMVLSSSVQATLEGRFADSAYGLSKKAAEDMLIKYSEYTSARVMIYRFPNIFGKWARPNYNSAVATFCHNIANDLPITVNDESTVLELLYIDDLIEEMLMCLMAKEHRISKFSRFCSVSATHKVSLGEIVKLLKNFKTFPETLMMPEMPKGSFESKLYSTYLSYLPKESAIHSFETKSDSRGSFTELIKSEKLGQMSVNISLPGETKGEHWHHSKWEIFIVVSGKARIDMRKIGSDEILSYTVSGDAIKAVYMLPGYTHSITNLSSTEKLVTLMWANETFDSNKPDTYYEKL
ncbi:MAG: NAD-dependent epimerase/dehydratase family protein [Clostridia bacterium]|nr:NAD-dependent epimerase/dehydratase family protein [Clostridia bacterium]